MAMAFTTIPTPIYALYQDRDGFPAWVVTVVFAASAVGVALSLYLAGHVSDWLGRRAVVVVALGIEILSAVLFLVWNNVVGLIVARFVSGLGIGAITATATAHLSELRLHRSCARHRVSGGPQDAETTRSMSGFGRPPR